MHRNVAWTILQRRCFGAAFFFACCLVFLPGQMREEFSLHAPAPTGWRYPTALELSDPIRDTSPHHFAKIVADFDGNGHPDIAVMLRQENSTAEGLWVWLAKGSESHWINLHSGEGIKDSGRILMGIDRQEAGALTIKCVDKSDDCSVNATNEPTLLWLQNPGIDYFRTSSSSSVFYWDSKQNKFLRAWTRDRSEE